MAANQWLPALGVDIPQGILLALVVAIVIVAVAVRINKGRARKNTPNPEPTPEPPRITERERQRLEVLKKEEEARKKKEAHERKLKAARLFRMVPPLGLIIFSIAIGWTNLVDFFVEGASVPEQVAYGSVFVFVVGTLWAGYERYRASGQAQTKTSFTLLLWALIALEGGVQFLHGLLFNPAVEWHGALFLAAMSPLAGIVFELAIAANRSEVKEAQEDQSNRHIPGSYKRNPLLYLKLLDIKAANPTWTAPEIVAHVRALDTTRAIRTYNRIMERPEWVRKLLGTRRHLDRITQTMIALNPHGAPPEDGRMVLARQLKLENSARAIAESGGDMYLVLTRLGVTPVVARRLLGHRGPKPTRYTAPQGVQNHPDPGVQNTPDESVQDHPIPGVQNTPAEGVQEDPPRGVQLTPDPGVQDIDPLGDVDLDAELAKLLGEHPTPPPKGAQGTPTKSVQEVFNNEQEAFNTPPTKSVQNTPKSVQQGKGLNTPSKPTKAKPNTTRPAGRKTGKTTKATKAPDAPKNRKATAEEQVNEVYSMVVEARKARTSDPSTRQIADALDCAVGTAANRLKRAKEEADRNGYHAVN